MNLRCCWWCMKQKQYSERKYIRFSVKYCSILGHQNFFFTICFYPRPFCSTGLYFTVLVPTQLPPQPFSVPVRHSQVVWCFIQHFGLPFLLRLMRTWHRSQLCTQPLCTLLSTLATLTFSFFFCFVCLLVPASVAVLIWFCSSRFCLIFTNGEMSLWTFDRD